MSAPVPQWPRLQPLVAGDDWTCVVNFPTDFDVAANTWRAAVCDYPEGPTVAEFTVTADGPAHRLVLTMPAADTEKLQPGVGFDLAQLTPVELTIFTVERIWLIASYSNEVA